ncbi:hypothetical protein DVH24_015153 [Malus domestica]|uniref:TIR domain-containing protein n=1 Tax=Malus domestica TaxID=3750 RepID=A0A498K6A0_MALDO|nr:hypothetical protein DVH24_015153 [Malus domestica]
MVIPVFYDIDLSNVQKQHGSYADAFAQLEKRFTNSIDKETPNVKAIEVDWYNLDERPLKHADFKKMSNLIILSSCGQLTAPLDLPDSLRYLYWVYYSLESLPSTFSSENLVELHMPNIKMLVNLQVIDLSHSHYLTEVPNLSGSLKIVHINLCGCPCLVEIPWYFQHLHKLTRLGLAACWSLKYLPEMPGSIKYLDLQDTGIKELPESVWPNENISYLNIRYCKDLDKLPSNMCKLKSKLGLVGCKQLQSLPELPVLCNVEAEGCTSLKTVSSTRTTLTQGWVQHDRFCKRFINCPKLDNNARSNIMEEAQIRIMREAN